MKLQHPDQSSAEKEVEDSTEPGPLTRIGDLAFEGTGWLMPVHSSKQRVPPYALLDAQGQVLHYVTPAPGMKLHRYTNKEVGVYGKKHKSDGLKATYIVAERVVDFDRHR